MAYERTRDNRENDGDVVAVKKSTLTAMTIALVILLGVTLILAWQNYEQNEQLNTWMNNRHVNAGTSTSSSNMSSQTSPYNT